MSPSIQSGDRRRSREDGDPQMGARRSDGRGTSGRNLDQERAHEGGRTRISHRQRTQVGFVHDPYTGRSAAVQWRASPQVDLPRGGSSVGQSRGLIILRSQVRVLPAPPIYLRERAETMKLLEKLARSWPEFRFTSDEVKDRTSVADVQPGTTAFPIRGMPASPLARWAARAPDKCPEVGFMSCHRARGRTRHERRSSPGGRDGEQQT
jgi:hypothetical protein